MLKRPLEMFYDYDHIADSIVRLDMFHFYFTQVRLTTNILAPFQSIIM